MTAPPSNLTRLYYNGSAAKSNSTTTQYRQLRYPFGDAARSHAGAARETRRESEKRGKKSPATCGSLSSPEMESLLGQARCRWSVGSFSIDNSNDSENVTFKMNSRLFQFAENGKFRRISLELIS